MYRFHRTERVFNFNRFDDKNGPFRCLAPCFGFPDAVLSVLGLG